MNRFKNIKKILVLKFRHIGDVLLIVPTIRALKETFPDASIAVAINAGTEDVLFGHPLIDEFIVFDRSILKMPAPKRIINEINFIKEIRDRRFDMTVDLTSGDRAAILSFLSGARHRLANNPGTKGFPGKRFIYSDISDIDKTKHMVIQNLNVIGKFGITTENREVDFFISDEIKKTVASLFEEKGIKKGDRIVQIHPTSRWMFKCWDDRYMAEIIEWLCTAGTKVILTSAPDKEELTRAERILSLLPAGTKCSGSIIPLFGKTTIKELGAISEAADLFIGVDSAPMHIAAAVKTPVIALFGPTGESTWAPYGENHIVLSNSLSCKASRERVW